MSERYVGQPLGERLEELGERVSELEKKYNTIGEKIPETIHKYYTKNKERIEKLEDSLQKCGVKWEFILDEHRGEINELKKSYRNNQTLRDKSFQHIYKIFKKQDKDGEKEPTFDLKGWGAGLELLDPPHMIVKKADLEELKRLNNEKDNEGIWINNRWKMNNILKKYLEDADAK